MTIDGYGTYMVKLIDSVQRRVEADRDRLTGLLDGLRRRWRSFDHLARAYERYREQHGDRLAASITFYAVLAFFPLTALAFALLGYAVAIDPHAREVVTDAIRQMLPGLADRLHVEQIAEAKAGAGVIGLVGLLWGGLGLIGVLRESLRTIWQVDPTGGGNFAVKKVWDLVVLVLLGLSVIASVVVSSFAISATQVVLSWLGMADVPGAGTMVRLLSIVVAVGTDMIIFFVLFSRLSGTRASWHRLVKGTLFGAIGFEVLKLLGTYLVVHTTRNPLYASFAVIIGVQVWINLASRFLLFTAAWTATRSAILRADADNPELAECTAPPVTVPQKPEKSEQPDESEQPEKSEQPEQPEKSKKPDKPEKSVPARSVPEQSAQSRQPDHDQVAG
jgi:membrane protein